jgi:hypothetical protein
VPRFLCGVMLRDLGPWMCVAGYDTIIAEGSFPTEHSPYAALKRIASC